MPKNKSAVIRYRAIDSRLRRKFRPFPTIEELREAVEEVTGDTISISSLQKDIFNMKHDPGLGYFAPIRYERARKGYFYEEPGYSIESVKLDMEEEEAIRFAVNLLNQYKGMPVLESFEGAIHKLYEKISVERLQPGKPIIDFEKAPSFKGSEWLNPLIDLISGEVVLQISYLKFNSSEPKLHTLHPYLLKEYRNRWYLIGWEEEKNEIRTFGLDRIASVEPRQDKAFIRTPAFDPQDYFKHSLGITTMNRRQPENIELEFSEQAAQYIQALPLHDSQQCAATKDKKLRVKLKLLPSAELIMTILSYGKDVTVVSPEWLQTEVTNRRG